MLSRLVYPVWLKQRRSVEQFEQDTLIPDARAEFAERSAEAYKLDANATGDDGSENMLIRDSTQNPQVLAFRVDKALVGGCFSTSACKKADRRSV